jgi:hypothetical protein
MGMPPSDPKSPASSDSDSSFPTAEPAATGAATPRKPTVREIGGPPGPEPTRYGDWEKNGRCIDF